MANQGALMVHTSTVWCSGCLRKQIQVIHRYTGFSSCSYLFKLFRRLSLELITGPMVVAGKQIRGMITVTIAR
jgi:hypothetical protein